MNEAVTAETSIAERFRAVAATIAESEALVSSAGRHTYGEIDRWSDAIASDIAALNLDVARPVAVITSDHVELVPMVLGIVKAGHFFVAIDAGEPEERIETILRASNVSLCLVPPSSDPATHGVPRMTLRALPDGPVAPPVRSPNELVHLVFTSGTTGTPKAVAYRQRSVVQRWVSDSAHTGRAAGERVGYLALPGFARATGDIFGSLLNGATLCAFDARRESLAALAGMIRRERVTVLNMTPALFRSFMRTLSPDADLSSIRRLRLGADVVTHADVEAWRARFPATSRFERSFNSTETGLAIKMTITHDMAIPGPVVPIGKAAAGVTLRLVDEEGNDVEEGAVGELIVRSNRVARGYWNAPELTASRFLFDPAFPDEMSFRTGDLLRRDPDGFYYFIGRADSRLKIHGRRIDPFEIENALLANGGIREAAVIGRTDSGGEQRLVAYVVAEPGVTLSPRDLRASLRDRVPAWMIPTRIHAIEALPVTPSGKIDRRSLAERPEPCMTGGDEVEAADALTETLLAIWSRVIGARVGIDDDFFDDLGAGSLSAALLVAEVKAATGISIPLSLLIELSTVAKMSRYLGGRPAMEHMLISITPGGTRPPLFCVSGKGGSVIIFRKLAQLLGQDQPFFGLTHHAFDPESFPTSIAAIAACYASVVLEKQPRGPYYLAGYSGGAFIAYELARLLWEEGHEVAFVGIIDAALSRERAPRWQRAFKYVSLLQQRPWKNGRRFARAAVRRVLWLSRWMTGRSQSFVPPVTVDPMVGLFNSMTGRDRLERYHGRLTLFRARHGWGTLGVHRDLGWGALCDSLEIVDVPGEHDTVLSDDVQGLADGFRRTLAAARSAASKAFTTAPQKSTPASKPGRHPAPVRPGA